RAGCVLPEREGLDRGLQRAARLVRSAVRDLGQGLAGGGIADGERARGAKPLAGHEGLPGPGRSITHEPPPATLPPTRISAPVERAVRIAPHHEHAVVRAGRVLEVV